MIFCGKKEKCAWVFGRFYRNESIIMIQLYYRKTKKSGGNEHDYWNMSILVTKKQGTFTKKDVIL